MNGLEFIQGELEYRPAGIRGDCIVYYDIDLAELAHSLVPEVKHRA
jgi:hypothetical protein